VSDRDSFLRANCAAPDDGAARLVFADWLDEQGDPDRAEFIRVQCAKARLAKPDDDFWPLGDREITLLDAHGTSWRDELAPALRGLWYCFERGFAESAIDAQHLTAHGHAIAEGPPLARLRVYARPRDARALARCPAFTRCLSVTFDGDLGGGDRLLAVLESPLLAHLTDLNGSRIVRRPEDIARLAGWTGLARLRGLRLNAGWRAESGLRDLAASPHVAGLRRLELHLVPADPEVLAAIGSSGSLAGLESLTVLGGSRADEDLASPFADTFDLPALVTLSLGVAVSRRAAEALASRPALATLRSLSLPNCGLWAEAVRPLLASPHLARLHTLDLSRNGLGNAGAATLAGATFAASLVSLNLNGDQIGPDGVRALAAADFPRLRVLRLGGNPIGPAGACLLAAARWREGLRVLSLPGCGIDDTGAAELMAGPALRELDLANNQLTADAVRMLAATPSLRWLRRLDLSGNRIGPSGTAALLECPDLDDIWEIAFDSWDNPDDLKARIRERFRGRYSEGIPF
jgi:uncharacterized protein (TIGR02996 family)